MQVCPSEVAVHLLTGLIAFPIYYICKKRRKRSQGTGHWFCWQRRSTPVQEWREQIARLCPASSQIQTDASGARGEMMPGTVSLLSPWNPGGKPVFTVWDPMIWTLVRSPQPPKLLVSVRGPAGSPCALDLVDVSASGRARLQCSSASVQKHRVPMGRNRQILAIVTCSSLQILTITLMLYLSLTDLAIFFFP